MRAWGAAGVSLPHSSSAQYGSGPHVSQSDIQPGDLVFFGSPIHHVGIYIGNGNMISARTPATWSRSRPPSAATTSARPVLSRAGSKGSRVPR